ncbi:hypothetical protein COW36_10965 [bacterium (Candidatus Blackallbacteria) CG17_big_fil_post_rev_8_21_14_2_50_48_46]|uniref:Peptidoglycan binding-like domain-containing protein n=1 Tax=bacterium (Candidatus Blackallbacteria) CG17_big_fil_post_rev_8_21_14_2_50_48_46 TaxID=2014261 RepID=A0A2M7G4T7_9BACT|nr:MAG: hypothetical protein COW36_10965 [bacterium (Candidatus Blackallbacteria) CG17_big_fil_post_rev_8_21_14_2_50_48_46]
MTMFEKDSVGVYYNKSVQTNFWSQDMPSVQQVQQPGLPLPVSPGNQTTRPVTSAPVQTQTAVTRPVSDKTQLGSQKGSALAALSFSEPVPAWSQKQKDAILVGFRAGLHLAGITPQEMTDLLRKNGISQLEINEQTIQDPTNAAEIEKIQKALDARLNHPDLRALGQANKVSADGQFGKSSVMAMAALKASDRGQDVELSVSPIRQQTRTGCYRTSEAMLFNALHGKDGTPDAYTEFDARDRIRDGDMGKNEFYVASKENAQGRVTVSKNQATKMLDQLDAELNAGRPAIVGVSYRKQDGNEYNEGVTDHFVLISGRGKDQAGTFYTFQDPAGGGTHKFRLDPATGRLSGKGDMVGTYDVTLMQTAETTDPATLERYQKTGKVLYSQGQSRAALATIQKQLTAMGFDTKGTSGAYGNGTAAAVRAFQEAHQLPVHGGSIDTHMLEALNTAFAEHQKTHPQQVMFQRGESSADLIPLQKALTKLGFNTQGVKGSFGPATESAVKAFQTKYQIEPTGKIDNQTWLRILQEAQS